MDLELQMRSPLRTPLRADRRHDLRQRPQRRTIVNRHARNGSRGCLIRRRSTASVLAPVVGRGAGRLLNHVPSVAVELWLRCAGVVTQT